MSEQKVETQPEQPPEQPPPTLPEEERPIIDLNKILAALRTGKGGGLGVAEAIMLMDFIDRREEREWRRQMMMRQREQHNSPSPEIQNLQQQINQLTQTVKTLMETIQKKSQEDAQRKFVEQLTQNITSQILPKIETLENRISQIEQQAQQLREAGKTEEASSLEVLAKELREAVEKLGEKAGASQVTLADLESLLDIYDRIEKRLGPKSTGEVDWRAVGINTVQELGKELIGAFREIETTKRQATAQQQAYVSPEAQRMRSVIKEQLKAYILRKMKAGATMLNVAEAAKDLGLTPQQIVEAYQELAREGWFHVKIPQEKPPVGKEEVPKTETAKTEAEAETYEGEQVFQPPAA